MPNPAYGRDIGDDLSDIRRRLHDAYMTARQAAARTVLQGVQRVISGAQLRVESATGTNAIMLAGSKIPMTGETDESYGMALYRPGGQVSFAAYKAAEHFRTAMFDKAGNRVVESDELEGAGLARPYVPVQFSVQTGSLWYPISVANSIRDTYTAYLIKQHPRIRVWAQVLTASTNTLTLDLFDFDNSVALDTVTVAANQSIVHMFDAPLSGEHLAFRVLTLRAVMTGTGTAYVNFLGGIGLESGI